MQDKTTLLVESVVPLTSSQLSDIKAVVVKKLKDIKRIDNVVNPALVGGIRLRFGGKLLDLSLKNKLDALNDHLNNYGK